MQDIVIFGTGGVGRQICQMIVDANEAGQQWHLLGYLDDDEDKHDRSISGVPVLGGVEWLLDHSDALVALAIGNPARKLRVRARIDAVADVRYATMIHPSVVLGSSCSIGNGSFIYAGCVIDPDVRISDFVLVNKLCSIGHDTRIGAMATLAPGVQIGGTVCIGSGCDVGIGSAAIQGISIGEWSIIGAGAVVVSDLDPNITAVGVPARVIKRRQPGWQVEV